MKEEEVERSSLGDLATILHEAKKLGIRLLLIGGYAVTAYTRGYRYTKDIDLVAEKPGVGKLKGLLRGRGYAVTDTEFGLKGTKRLNQDFVDLHISVGEVYDASSGKRYPIDRALFRRPPRLVVRGFYARTTAIEKVPVVDLETLVFLKLMPLGREKDAVDVISLLLDKSRELDTKLLTQRASTAGFREELLARVRDFASRLRGGEADKIWFNETAVKLLHVDKRNIGRLLSALANQLRQPQPSPSSSFPPTSWSSF
jgi:hypothetical protein